MNTYFEETTYHLKRATKTARAGVAAELEPLRERVADLRARESDPEPGRVEALRADLEELAERAEGETREALERARERLAEYRKTKPSP